MLVIHAGPHKTATSYVQKHFWDNRAGLAQRGWDYPEMGDMARLMAHHDLAHHWEKYLGQDTEKAADLIRIGRQCGDNILLSAEGLRVWAPWQFEALMRLLNRQEAELVYAIRDPVTVFYSYWAEEVKQGYTASLPERFADHFNDPHRSPILNPLIDLNRYRRVPGLRLRVVPFDVLAELNLDLYEHICRAVLRIEPPEIADKAPINQRYPIEQTEFLRLITRLEAGANQIIGPDFRARFNAAYSPERRGEMAELVRQEGATARRAIQFPEGLLLKTGIEQMLRKTLQEDWTLDPGDHPLFPRGAQELAYYDMFELWQIAPIRDRAIDVWKSLAR